VGIAGQVLQSAAGAAPIWKTLEMTDIPGAAYKATCRVASTANITTLSGLLTIDGIVLVANDRVLVKDQTASQNNGIYIACRSLGKISRSKCFFRTQLLLQ
jgi:phage-related tail fiber protein